MPMAKVANKDTAKEYRVAFLMLETSMVGLIAHMG